MKKKTPVEMERAAMLARARAEGTILRMRWLNEVVPALEAEFDRRILSGESTTLLVPSINDFLNEAIKQIEAAKDDLGGDDVVAA